MTVGEQNYSSLHFSTRKLGAAKRLPAVRELFDRSVQLELDAEPNQIVEMEMFLAPGLRRARMLSSFTACLTRSAPMLADGEDTICLMMKTSGHMAVAQGRHEAVPHRGDGVLLVYREPARLQFVDISPLTRNAAAAAARCIPYNVEALSLLRGYIATLPERFADPQLGRLSASHVYDLVAMAIGATEEGREIASQRGIRAARLEAIKADMVQNTRFNLDQLAKRQGISPRYIQMLFEETGTTFSEFALACRLDAASRMLTSPRYAGLSITSVAFEAGFNDLSHFNRRFKRRYSMAPSDMRALTKG